MIASLTYGINNLFARNPGLSTDREGVFPIFSARDKVCCNVSSEVCSPVMISTPFITGTGFYDQQRYEELHTMKCMPITRSWAPTAAAAIFVMLIELVFVAKIA